MNHTEQQEKKSPFHRLDSFAYNHRFNPLTFKLAIVALILLLILLMFLGVGSEEQYKSRTTDLGLKNIGELATQAGYFRNVQVIRGARDLWGVEIPFTQSSYIYSYDGVIKAGIDFEKVEINADNSTKEIHVKLPEVKVLNTTIDEDSLQVYDEQNSIYTPLTVSKMNESIADLKREAEETAIANGLLENARTNAEMLIRGYLTSVYDLQVYTIVFE